MAGQNFYHHGFFFWGGGGGFGHHLFFAKVLTDKVNHASHTLMVQMNVWGEEVVVNCINAFSKKIFEGMDHFGQANLWIFPQ